MMGEDGKSSRWILIQREKDWRLEGRSLCPSRDALEKTTATIEAWAKDVQRFRKAIGRPGIKPEDVDCELGRAMTKSMTGIDLPPKRFDINQLK
jgi:hypothetical protein